MTDTRPDDDLIADIAIRRDRDSFAALYDRYMSAAYNLALHLTSNTSLADEAVQEAMLRVWQSAHMYRPGNARGWVLRIVAHESIRKIKEQRRAAMEPVSKETAPQAGAENSTENTEHNELLSALRRVMQELPLQDKQIVALHFGAGFSQHEISVELAIPQQTISFRIKKSLESLRNKLSVAGFASAAFILSNEQVSEAVCTGAVPPAGHCQSVLARLSQAPRISVRHISQRAAKSKASQIVVGSAVAAALLVLAWWGFSSSKPGSPLPKPVPVATAPAPVTVTVPAAVPVEAARPRTPFARSWNFNTREQANDFKVVAGSWHWVPDGGPDGSGCMETDGGAFEACVDVPFENLPVYATLQLSARPQGVGLTQSFQSNIVWEQNLERAQFLNIAPVAAFTNVHWDATRHFITAKSIDTWVSGKRIGLQIATPKPHTRLALFFNGVHRIDDLEISEILPEEIPVVDTFLMALQKIPQEKRSGVVDIPELPSARPPEPVRIVFSSAATSKGAVK